MPPVAPIRVDIRLQRVQPKVEKFGSETHAVVMGPASAAFHVSVMDPMRERVEERVGATAGDAFDLRCVRTDSLPQSTRQLRSVMILGASLQ
jgi:hypothetical protein